MYKLLFSLFLTPSLLSAALGAGFDIDPANPEKKPNPLAVRQNIEKTLGLPEKKHQAKKLKNELALQQQNLKAYEKEAISLKEKLDKIPGYQQLLKRQEHVKKELETLPVCIYALQQKKLILEDEIGSSQESVQKHLANSLLFKELLKNRSQAESIDETNELYAFKSPGTQVQVSRLFSNLPQEILELILSNMIWWDKVPITPKDFNLIPHFPDLWSARLVSKTFKRCADNILKTKELITSGQIRSTDINIQEIVRSAMKSLSLKKLFLVGNWDPPSLERLSELLSTREFSQITSLFYIQSGLAHFNASNPLGSDGAYYLSRVFKFLPNLGTLRIEGTLDEEGGKYIASSLYHLSKLRSLSIVESVMGPFAMKEVAKGLEYLPLLKRLDLWGSNPGDIGAVAIAKYLKYAAALQFLGIEQALDAGHYDYESKVIHLAGLTKLSQAFTKHPSIRSVYIRGHATQGVTVLDNLKNKNQEDIAIIK